MHLNKITSSRVRRTSKPFRFKEYWVCNPECEQLISEQGHWSNATHNYSFSDSIQASSSALRHWGRSNVWDLFKQIKAQKAAIIDAYNQPLPLDFTIIHALENDLAGLLELEEIFWKQRSREDWLKWGIAILNGSTRRPL